MLLALAGWLSYRRGVAVWSGGNAEGTVTEHQRREIDESVGFHPCVFFRDETGVGHHFVSNAGWGSPRPPVGAKVKVVYVRSNPEVAYIDSFLHLWAAPLALLAMAAAALVAAFTLKQ